MGRYPALQQMATLEPSACKNNPGEDHSWRAECWQKDNVGRVTATERGVLIEGKDIASRLPEISKAVEKNGETVVVTPEECQSNPRRQPKD